MEAMEAGAMRTFLAISGALLLLAGCGGGDAQLTGPIVLIEGQERLTPMVDDIWPGVTAKAGYSPLVGYTGGLRMVVFTNIMIGGSVETRPSAYVFEVPPKTSADAIRATVERVMREGQGMRAWNATLDGTEIFSMRGQDVAMERFTVNIMDRFSEPATMTLHLLTRPVGDHLGVLALTSLSNAYKDPKAATSLHEFLANVPSS